MHNLGAFECKTHTQYNNIQCHIQIHIYFLLDRIGLSLCLKLARTRNICLHGPYIKPIRSLRLDIPMHVQGKTISHNHVFSQCPLRVGQNSHMSIHVKNLPLNIYPLRLLVGGLGFGCCEYHALLFGWHTIVLLGIIWARVDICLIG